MKQIKQVFFVLTIFLFLQGCSDKSAKLTKTWVLKDLQFPTEVPAGLKPTIDQWVGSMKGTYSLTYNADHTYISKLGEQELKGTWKLNWNSSKITSTPTGGDAKSFKITELTDNAFTFETELEKATVIFVMQPAPKATDAKPK